MKAKDMIIDFINYAFLLALMTFLIIYFIAGDRFFLFTRLLKSLLPLSLFGIILLIKIKMSRNSIKKGEVDNDLDETIAYIIKKDIIKDLIIIAIMPIIIIMIALLDISINFNDIFQAILIFIIMLLWHIVLFKKKEDMNHLVYITNLDIIKDEVVIFLMPVLIIAIALMKKNIDIIDIMQALFPFIIFYVWHKRLFRKSNG